MQLFVFLYMHMSNTAFKNGHTGGCMKMLSGLHGPQRRAVLIRVDT